MAFVVEDGTGLVNANSYATVMLYRGYWTDRGRDTAGQSDDQVQGFLVRATDYIERRFGAQYRGERSTLTQSLGFPRSCITVDGVRIEDDVVPVMLQFATIEYAWRASLYAELAPDPPMPFAREGADGSALPAGGAVIEESKKVGPIEKSVVYSDPRGASTSWSMPSYPAADQLMSRLLKGTGGGTMRS